MLIVSLEPDGLHVADGLMFGESSQSRIDDDNLFKYWLREVRVSAGVKLTHVIELLRKMPPSHREILENIANVDIHAIIEAVSVKRKSEVISDVSSLVVSEGIKLKGAEPFNTFVTNMPARAHRTTPEITRNFFMNGKILGPPDELTDVSMTPIIDLVDLPITIDHAICVDVSELIPFGPLQTHQAMSLSDFVLTVLDELGQCILVEETKELPTPPSPPPATEVVIDSDKISFEESVNAIQQKAELITDYDKLEKKEFKHLKKRLKKQLKKDIAKMKKRLASKYN